MAKMIYDPTTRTWVPEKSLEADKRRLQELKEAAQNGGKKKPQPKGKGQ